MKRVSLLPNLITAFGLACGLFVIFKVNMVESGSGDYEVIKISTVLLLIAAVADLLDGAVARIVRAESEFGFVFDTLADTVSFGVAPSVLMLKALGLEQGDILSFFAATGAMVYSLCGVLRLVRFNVKAVEARGDQDLEIDRKKNFIGLPIPAAAGCATSLNLLFLSPLFQRWIVFSQMDRAIFLSSVMIFLGYLMVSPLKFPSLKMLRFKIPSFQLAFFAVVIAVFILYGMLYFFAEIFVILAWFYVLLSLTLSLIRFIMGKKSKTLEDFDPEPEDFDSFLDK